MHDSVKARDPRRLPLLTLAIMQAYATAAVAGGDIQEAGLTSFRTQAVSGDGTTVVGYSSAPGSNSAVSWTESGGAVTLDPLDPESTNNQALSVSRDGSVIVGRSIGSDGFSHAVIWTSSGIQDLGTFGGTYAEARGVSKDGSVVVGYSNVGAAGSKAFRWTSSGSMLLDDIAGGSSFSFANATNADGSIVVGYSDDGGEYPRPTVWASESEWLGVGLGGLTGAPIPWGDAVGVNDSGSTIVGWVINADFNNQAVRWDGNVTDGYSVTALEALHSSPDDVAYAVNADGSVVVGKSKFAASGASLAVRWDTAGAVQLVTDWLADNGVTVDSGFSLDEARGVSDDGNVVVGRDSSSGDAWIARVSTSGSGAVMLSDLADSLVSSAVAGGQMLTQTGTLLNGAHSRPLQRRVSDNRTVYWVAGDLGRDDHAERDGDLGLAEFGVGRNFGQVQANLSLGKLWGKQNGTLGGRSEADAIFVAAEALAPLAQMPNGKLWGVLTAQLFNGDADITRGYLNAGTPDSSRADTDLSGWGLRARLEWDEALPGVSPYADLSYNRMKLDSYTETGGGFPARFDARTDAATELRLGSDLSYPLTEQLALIGTAEGVHRFEDGGDSVTGEVIGLTPFSFSADKVKQNWLRVGAGIAADTAHGSGSLMLNGTTEGGSSNLWLAASWQGRF